MPMLRALRSKISSALRWSRNSTTVTCLTTPARSIAASTPELPPPITATSLPLKRGPSQWGQKVTPLLRYSVSPGTPRVRQRAPVARMTVRERSVPPLSRVIVIRPSSPAGVSPAAIWFFMMSTSYACTWASSAVPSSGPWVSRIDGKFSIELVSRTWPPMRSTTRPVRMPLRAA